MKKKHLIDTNIFLEIMLRRDEVKYKDCEKLFKKIKTNKIQAVTTNLVIAELVWTLKSFYKFPKLKIIKGLKGIKRLRGLRLIDSYHFEKVIRQFELKSIKYIDALIASIKPVEEKKWVVVSYDKDFDKLDVLRKEPNRV